jgi:hypothetical protein
VADVHDTPIAGEALGSGVGGWCGSLRGVHWVTPFGPGSGGASNTRRGRFFVYTCIFAHYNHIVCVLLAFSLTIL